MTARSAPLLAAHGLTAGYGKIDILHGVSLEVNPRRLAWDPGDARRRRGSRWPGPG